MRRCPTTIKASRGGGGLSTTSKIISSSGGDNSYWPTNVSPTTCPCLLNGKNYSRNQQIFRGFPSSAAASSTRLEKGASEIATQIYASIYSSAQNVLSSNGFLEAPLLFPSSDIICSRRREKKTLRDQS